MAGMLIFAGIRLLGVAVAAFMLRHGKYELRHWSLVRWMRGRWRPLPGHCRAWLYLSARPMAHASVFAWFPGYPAVMNSVAWLPGVSLVAAGSS